MADHLRSQAVRNNQAYGAGEKQQLKRVRAEEGVMPASAAIGYFDHADGSNRNHTCSARWLARKPVHRPALLLQQRSQVATYNACASV